MVLDKEQHLKELGKRIKELRLEQKLTQAELGALVNKDQQSIQRLEAGRINPSYLYLCEIMAGLGRSINQVANI
jgi:transcriptional regulator with XRE-family HTH domain